jgi:hypothetical protein
MKREKLPRQKARALAEPNYTQGPNVFFDEWLPEIKNLSELKVIVVIIRGTFGWHQDNAQLSISDLERLTGLSRTSVIEGARFVMLTQASVDSSWFWKMFPFCTSYALRRRMIFIGSKYVFPKPLILSAFNCVRIGAEPGPSGRLHEWDWMKDIGDGRYMKGE